MAKEATGDRGAQKARAQSIRERIRELKSSKARTAGDSKPEAERQPSKSESAGSRKISFKPRTEYHSGP